MGWENYGVLVGNYSDPGDKSYSLADRSAAKVTHWLTGNLANREITKNFHEYKIKKTHKRKRSYICRKHNSEQRKSTFTIPQVTKPKLYQKRKKCLPDVMQTLSRGSRQVRFGHDLRRKKEEENSFCLTAWWSLVIRIFSVVLAPSISKLLSL